MIPNVGTITPMRMSEEAGMNRTVLEKRIAVEVMVVNPGVASVSGCSQKIPREPRTIGEEEPSCQVLESVPQFLNLLPAEHISQLHPGRQYLSAECSFLDHTRPHEPGREPHSRR